MEDRVVEGTQWRAILRGCAAIVMALVALVLIATEAHADSTPVPTATRSPLAYANCHAEVLYDSGRDGEIDERVTYEYDSRGSIVRETSYAGKGPAVRAVSYSVYDDQRNRTLQYNDTGADGTIESGTRWAWQGGHLVRVDSLLGTELRVQSSRRWVRDDQDRLVAEISENADGAETSRHTYHYSGPSRLASRVESDWGADGTIDSWENLAYLGGVLSKVRSYDVLWQGGAEPQSIDTYSYDRELLSRIDTLRSNECRDWVTWSYNDFGWVTEARSTRGCGGTVAIQQFRYDDLGRLKTTSNGVLKDEVGTAERPAPPSVTTYRYSCGAVGD